MDVSSWSLLSLDIIALLDLLLRSTVLSILISFLPSLISPLHSLSPFFLSPLYFPSFLPLSTSLHLSLPIFLFLHFSLPTCLSFSLILSFCLHLYIFSSTLFPSASPLLFSNSLILSPPLYIFFIPLFPSASFPLLLFHFFFYFSPSHPLFLSWY